jgi:hypothetical protein
MKMILGDFNAKLWGEDIFKPPIGNKSLHQDSNDKVKVTMFPHRKINKYALATPDRKTHNQIDQV